MKIGRTFAVATTETSARQLTISNLTQAGYRIKDEQQGRMVFGRGSLLGTLTGFDPKSWAAEMTASFSLGHGEVAVRLRCKVNTTGQIVTANEAAWWNAATDGLVTVLSGENTVSSTVEPVNAGAASVRNQGLRIGATILAIVMVVAFAVGIVGNALLDSMPSGSAVVVGGLAVAVGLIVAKRYGGSGKGKA
ncbi:MAG: hypothetical protein ACYC1C_08985 [Chloroflexota bacterium]